MGRSRETDEWGVGEKVSVDVGSLEKLAQQIKDDMDAFHEWVEVWQQTGAETNPSNAQFTSLVTTSDQRDPNASNEQMPAGAMFREAVYVEAYNNGALYGQMRGLIMLMQMGVGALYGGANFLATMYRGVDGYNNVRLGMVEDMFPALPMKDPGDIGTGAPPGQGWTVAKDGKGWDKDNDGDTDVPFAASGGPPAGIEKGDSKMKRPEAVEGSTHEGYVKAIDTRPGQDLDGATQADYENNKEETESNMPIARWGEDAWNWAVDTAEAVDNFTDGENDPNTWGRW
jgi:hypothetical protein